jgi:hypothetical protein
VASIELAIEGSAKKTVGGIQGVVKLDFLKVHPQESPGQRQEFVTAHFRVASPAAERARNLAGGETGGQRKILAPRCFRLHLSGSIPMVLNHHHHHVS